MPLNIEHKIYIEDYNKDIGTLGIMLPMNSDNRTEFSSIFSMSQTTEQQAISNYINLLLTKKGERIMQPEYGVGLMYYIFEQNSDYMNTYLKDEIEAQAAIWLPYIVNKNISVSRTSNNQIDEHAISIHIQFQVFEHGANRTISIFTPSEQTINIQVQ